MYSTLTFSINHIANKFTWITGCWRVEFESVHYVNTLAWTKTRWFISLLGFFCPSGESAVLAGWPVGYSISNNCPNSGHFHQVFFLNADVLDLQEFSIELGFVKCRTLLFELIPFKILFSFELQTTINWLITLCVHASNGIYLRNYFSHSI